MAETKELHGSNLRITRLKLKNYMAETKELHD